MKPVSVEKLKVKFFLEYNELYNEGHFDEHFFFDDFQIAEVSEKTLVLNKAVSPDFIKNIKTFSISILRFDKWVTYTISSLGPIFNRNHSLVHEFEFLLADASVRNQFSKDLRNSFL